MCPSSWWHHQMEIFSALLVLCAGNSTVTGEFPTQRPVTHSFDVFFVLVLNKRLSKQLWVLWFQTPSRPLWRHCNGDIWMTSILNSEDDGTNSVVILSLYAVTKNSKRYEIHKQYPLLYETKNQIISFKSVSTTAGYWRLCPMVLPITQKTKLRRFS